MARYARTKDGVYQILGETKISDTCIRYNVKPNKELEYYIFSENIIKESDKLEDFLEVVVVIRPNGIREVFLDTPKYLVRCFDLDYENCEVYGGIWIKTGIKYFVKKTKNNKMELI